MKRGVLLIGLLLIGGVLAQSQAPDTYEYKLRYASGTIIQPWVVECDTNPNTDAHDGDSGFVCSAGVGTNSNPIDCSEEGDIKATWRMFHEPDVGLPYKYTYSSDQYLYTIDYDNDQADCDCIMGEGNWNIGGDALGAGNLCCADPGDTGEFKLSRTCSSACSSDPGDDACCSENDDCVYASLCFDDNECYSGIFCNSGNWHDSDEDKNYCDTCIGSGNWNLTFEAGNPPCCGDDAGEFHVYSNTNTACCDSPDDFVHSGSVCEDAANLISVTGIVQGQRADSTYGPLQGARVVVTWKTWLTVNLDYTDANGFYNVSIPSGTFHLNAQKPGFSTMTIENVIISGDINQTFMLPLTNECRSDCTRFEHDGFRCSAECDGINNCNFDPNVISDQYGGTMKELCNNNEPGWTIKHNSTHDIQCCDSGYVTKRKDIEAWIEISDKVRQAQTYFAGVINFIPTGELYSVYVVIYSSE